jgi:hypothetical protein
MKTGSTASWRGIMVKVAILVAMMAVDGGVLAENFLFKQASLSSSKEHCHGIPHLAYSSSS